MVDTELIVDALRKNGHEVTEVVSTPANAGSFEFMVDGSFLTLVEVRELLESESPA